MIPNTAAADYNYEAWQRLRGKRLPRPGSPSASRTTWMWSRRNRRNLMGSGRWPVPVGWSASSVAIVSWPDLPHRPDPVARPPAAIVPVVTKPGVVVVHADSNVGTVDIASIGDGATRQQ